QSQRRRTTTTRCPATRAETSGRPHLRPCGLQVEAVCEPAEHVDELLDLRVGVRCGDLDPAADLVARDEWVRSQRHVDAVLEQEAPDRVDVLMAPQWNLDDREARAVGRMP